MSAWQSVHGKIPSENGGGGVWISFTSEAFITAVAGFSATGAALPDGISDLEAEHPSRTVTDNSTVRLTVRKVHNKWLFFTGSGPLKFVLVKGFNLSISGKIVAIRADAVLLIVVFLVIVAGKASIPPGNLPFVR